MQVVECNVNLNAELHLTVCFALAEEASDPISLGVASGSWLPPDALRWLLLTISPGEQVLDLGGHIGTLALPAAQLGAKVTVVEASPKNVALLRRAIEANGFESNVTVVEGAITSEPGPISFIDHGPYGTLETESTGRSSGWTPITVDGITVDSLGLGSPTWIKMDIEGAECAALAGASRTLSRASGLVVESNAHMLREHGTSPTELIAGLENLGYLFHSVHGETLVPLARSSFQPETTTDYIATRGGAPALPPGWHFGRQPTRREQLGILVDELHHTVPQHRASALITATTGPLWVRRSPSVRRAAAELRDDDTPHVAAARAYLAGVQQSRRT